MLGVGSIFATNASRAPLKVELNDPAVAGKSGLSVVPVTPNSLLALLIETSNSVPRISLLSPPR